MYQRTVLIVEDEPLIRMMLADALEDESYGVIEAASALEAIAILATSEPDVVITDIDMPGGLSGLDLADYIAAYRKGLPVLVTSGGRMIAPGELPGKATFMAKPYNLGHVLDVIGQWAEPQPMQPLMFTELRVA
jgi:DNA-binding NtrC family response regulator